ncbi:MAG: hypothetical protein NVS9B14_12500 [Candidatus Acidiferrum sp.]
MDAALTARPGLLPSWLRLGGWVILVVQSLFIARIVYESTFLTCWDGPQMIGFALAHSGPGIFLVGIFFLPMGALFLLLMVVFGLFKKLRFDQSEWLLLCAFAVGFLLLSVPYSAWKRLDMKVCSSGPLGDDFLQVAAFKGDLAEVEKLVRQGHNINHEFGDGSTVLTGGIRGRRYDVVRFLLSNGADVNKRSWLSDETPLMVAASLGDTEMIQLLLAHGADPCMTVKDSDNQNAQRIAEKEQKYAVAKYLASHSDCKLPPPAPMACTDKNSATCVEVH